LLLHVGSRPIGSMIIKVVG